MSAAAAREPLPVGLGRARWAPAAASVCGLLVLAATVEIVLDGAVEHSALIPKQPAIAGWLSGIGERLGYRVFLIALLVAVGAYAGVLWLVSRMGEGAMSKRFAIALIAVLHAVLFVGPVLISTDVFSYIAYARMGVEHGLNPYLHGPSAIPHDEVFRYVGHDWRRTPTAYGPLYTLLSYPLAPLGLRGALWAMKLEALLASIGTLVLVWRCALARGFEPMFALVAVALNPLYLIYGLGGSHNDLLMMLAMMGAVALMLAPRPTGRREAGAAAVIVAGALIKATVAVLLPFMVLARRRVAPVLGALAAIVAGALIAYAAFGSHGVDVVSALNRDAAFVSTDSFANEIAHLFGKPGVFPIDHDLLKVALVLIVAHLLWRTWRGYDWIAASGWSLLAISVTSTWLLAWYILWPLPLAVVSRDRRLLVATLAIQGLFVVHQISPLLVPVK
ncbi:MAG TPA: glycosyltransferase 87 family protein [Solirubrobacteraceae bacterium]|nr:glycosyltransferase 87 family protein [Solirubrobacteraceae bacterium]